MKFIFSALLIVAVLPAKSFGISSISNGLQAASAVGGSILANPPLPMLYFKSGNKKLSIQPAYAEGSIDAISTPSNGGNGSFHETGKIFGGGGALSYSHALGNSFGLYFLAVGSKVGGDFQYAPADGANADTMDMKEIQSTFAAGGLGFLWTMIGGESDDVFSLGLFSGPAVANYALSQRVVNTMSNGTITDDFTMKTDITIPTMFIGLQIGIRMGGFLINPYFVGFTDVNAKKCHDYEVTEVSVNGNLDGASTTECGGDGMGGGTTTNQISVIDGITGFGVNFSYLPLNLAVNAFADSGEPKGLKGFQTKTYYLTLSLGTD